MSPSDGFEETNETLCLTSGELRGLHRSPDDADEGALVLVVQTRDGVRSVPLADGREHVIGRYAPADIPIADRSVSREHATVVCRAGQVWIEDHGSTNGTFVGGERIDRRPVSPGEELAFGAVPATVEARGADGNGGRGIDGHDSFLNALEADTARSLAFGRPLTLLVVRRRPARRADLARWFLGIRERLRPFDSVALYSGDTVEILLPEAPVEHAEQLGRALLDGPGEGRCAIARLPDHAAGAEELLDVALRTLRRTTAARPLRVAGGPAGPDDRSEDSLDDAAKAPVARSEVMRRLLETAARLAASSIPVLIVGETGTGKEVLARAIAGDGRALVTVNCGGIPDNLVESTLFGHRKGAFTGASRTARGVFEAADGGTVFLDEIGELPASAQAALLRVLDHKRITRVGDTAEVEVDVRVLAATHRDLESMCEAGAFRWDLFYRLNAMTLEIPPLRERVDDIEPLAERFLARANRDNGRALLGIDDEARALLLRHRWPGNARELRNAIERAVVISRDDVIVADDLPRRLRELETPTGRYEALSDEELAGPAPAVGLREALDRFEAAQILAALRAAGGDRRTAAERLGLPLRTLAHKMRRHGIRRAAYQRVEG